MTPRNVVGAEGHESLDWAGKAGRDPDYVPGTEVFEAYSHAALYAKAQQLKPGDIHTAADAWGRIGSAYVDELDAVAPMIRSQLNGGTRGSGLVGATGTAAAAATEAFLEALSDFGTVARNVKARLDNVAYAAETAKGKVTKPKPVKSSSDDKDPNKVTPAEAETQRKIEAAAISAVYNPAMIPPNNGVPAFAPPPTVAGPGAAGPSSGPGPGASNPGGHRPAEPPTPGGNDQQNPDVSAARSDPPGNGAGTTASGLNPAAAQPPQQLPAGPGGPASTIPGGFVPGPGGPRATPNTSYAAPLAVTQQPGPGKAGGAAGLAPAVARPPAGAPGVPARPARRRDEEAEEVHKPKVDLESNDFGDWVTAGIPKTTPPVLGVWTTAAEQKPGQ